MRLALYQPEIPQNTGTLIRLCHCFGLGLDIIEPCGFVWDDKKLARACMDYYVPEAITRHASWDHFLAQVRGRVVLVDVRGTTPYTQFEFRPDDVILMGRESDGVPTTVAAQTQASIYIPMRAGRSLNLACAAAIVTARIVQ